MFVTITTALFGVILVIAIVIGAIQDTRRGKTWNGRDVKGGIIQPIGWKVGRKHRRRSHS